MPAEGAGYTGRDLYAFTPGINVDTTIMQLY